MGFRVGDITLRMENHNNELVFWNFVLGGGYDGGYHNLACLQDPKYLLPFDTHGTVVY